FSVLQMKSPVAVGANPHVAARSVGDRCNCAGRRRDLYGLNRITVIEERAVFAAALTADPETTFRISRHGIDEITARLANNLFYFSVFDHQDTATLCTDEQLAAGHRQAGDFQESGMVLVFALQGLVRNHSYGKRKVRRAIAGTRRRRR